MFSFWVRSPALPNGHRTILTLLQYEEISRINILSKGNIETFKFVSDALGRALTVTLRCLSAALWWPHCGKLISVPQLFSLFLSVSMCCISFDNTTFISTGSICAIMFFLPPLLTVKTRCNTSAEACVAWIIEDISSHELISAACGWATPESCVDKRSAVWRTYYRLRVI